MNNLHMFKTLFNLKGNSKACVYTEPLWSIPYFLYIPYASVYMLALGITELQIGYIITLGMISQVIFSLLGGLITDKLGRRRTTFIFDMISWGIPTLIWAVSQNFTHFAIAAAINGAWRITANSWTCLLVEDEDEHKLVSIFSWIHITGLLAAFFSPLTGIFVKNFNLIPTIRVIYFMTFFLMIAKFIILNSVATETKRGKERMEATKHMSYLKMLKGYRHIIRHILSTKNTIFTVAIMIIVSIISTINSSFWGIIVTGRLGIGSEFIGVFTAIKSVVMMIFYLGVLPKIGVHSFKRPMALGFLTMLLSQIVLVTTSQGGFFLLVVSILFEGVSFSLINPLLDSLQVVMIDKNERARIMALLYTMVILITAPFGSLAGYLSTLDQRLPFIMNMVLVIIGLVMILLSKQNKSGSATL